MFKLCDPITSQPAPLEHKVILCRWLYGYGKDCELLPPDFQYALMEQECKEKGLIPEYMERSWSSDPCPTELLKKYGLEEYIYDITLADKTESIPSITQLEDAREFYGSRVSEWLVSYKMDGWNTQLTYVNGHLYKVMSRGRETAPQDFTKLGPIFPQTIDIMGEVKVCLELFVGNTNFKRLKDRFPEKNLISQRLAISCAIANAHDLLEYRAFTIISSEQPNMRVDTQYHTLIKWGFPVPEWRLATDLSSILEAVEALSISQETSGMPTDGAVVRECTSHEARALRLYGWTEEIYASYITGYVDEDGKGSLLSAKLKIRPTRLINQRQALIPATNYRRIIDNHWEVGSPIVFRLVSFANAQPDIRLTEEMQAKYAGAYDLYRERIDMYENIKEADPDNIKGIIREYGLYV